MVFALTMLASILLSAFAELKANSDRSTTLPRRGSIAALLAAVVLIGVSSLRWGVGADYWNYYRNFPDYAREFVEDFSLFGEPGIRFFAWLGMNLNGDSAIMFGLAALVTIGLTMRTLWRWSPAFTFAVVMYILTGAWSDSFNGVRQFLAGAVLFAGHRYIITRRFRKWFAVTVIAMLFHISAVVALFLYFLPTKRTSWKIQGSILMFGILGMLIIGPLIDFLAVFSGDPRWEVDYVHRAVNPLRIAFAFVPLMLYWLLANKRAIEEYGAWFYINVLAVYAATFLASATSAYMARFVIYSTPFVILGLVAVTSVESKSERLLIRLSVAGLYFVFFYFDILIGSEDFQNFEWLFDRN